MKTKSVIVISEFCIAKVTNNKIADRVGQIGTNLGK
jgi:hypothetical protein